MSDPEQIGELKKESFKAIVQLILGAELGDVCLTEVALELVVNLFGRILQRLAVALDVEYEADSFEDARIKLYLKVLGHLLVHVGDCAR